MNSLVAVDWNAIRVAVRKSASAFDSFIPLFRASRYAASEDDMYAWDAWTTSLSSGFLDLRCRAARASMASVRYVAPLKASLGTSLTHTSSLRCVFAVRVLPVWVV